MTHKAAVFMAEGFEEIEALTCVDVLRRAKVEVTTVGVGGTQVAAAHGVTVLADVSLESFAAEGATDQAALVFPGGMPGSKNLGAHPLVGELAREALSGGKIVAAICAAPALVLAPAGILDGKQATCYPGFESEFGDSVTYREDAVVTDGNVVTSRGPGTALPFALALAGMLAGQDVASALAEGMLFQA